MLLMWWKRCERIAVKKWESDFESREVRSELALFVMRRIILAYENVMNFLAVEGRWASASLTNSPRAFVFSLLDFSRIEWRKTADQQFCDMYGGDWSTILTLVSEPNASRIRLGNACHVFCFCFPHLLFL